MFGLGHASFEWLFSGAIIFVGLIVFFAKISRGHYFSTFCSACVWYFVYQMHGGSTQGVMSATWAALLFDAIGMPLLKLLGGRKNGTQ